MFLRAEDRSKAQVISSDDDRASLAVCAEHSPALEPRSDGFSVYGGVEVVITQWHLCCYCFAVKALMFKWQGLPEYAPIFAYFRLYSTRKKVCCFMPLCFC